MFLILVCLFGFFSTTSVSLSGEESQLTDVDKIQIVKTVLEERLSNHKVYPLGETLILSTENINVELIPTSISGIELSFLKPDEIKKRDKGNISYLSFGIFNPASTGIEISLNEIWRDGIARGWIRTTYKCQKVKDIWQIEEGEQSIEIFN